VTRFLENALPLKISIVDNSSTIDNFQLLKEQLPPSVVLIRLEENKGWGGGLNLLLNQWLAEQTSPYCFVSAHDALPQGDCLKMLVECMEFDERIGIASPEYGSSELPKYNPVKGPYMVPIPPRISGTVESVDFAHATLMIFRRKCIEEIGVFDERYFAYGDEYDISLKARRCNWKAAVIWGAVVVNPGSWTPKPKLSYLFARNTLLLALTYGGIAHAFMRATFMILNTLRIVLNPFTQKTNFHPIARILGIRDFLLGRYGHPPL